MLEKYLIKARKHINPVIVFLHLLVIGRTTGKMLLGTKVISGGKISTAFVRNFGEPVVVSGRRLSYRRELLSSNRSYSELNLSPLSKNEWKLPAQYHKIFVNTKISSNSLLTNYNSIPRRQFGTKHKTSLDDENESIDTNGAIMIMNDSTAHPTLDNVIPQINSTVDHIRDILGYPNYSVVLALVDDSQIQEMNYEFLGKNRPTDILSFPFDGDVIEEPGILKKPEFDIPEMYTLGDMMISVPYVMRRAEEDMKDLEEMKKSQSGLIDDEDRGISGIMATMPTVEERIPALLVHGMLHLVGYDHIEDDDYELMVKKEEEVWQELQHRMKTDNI